MTALGRLPAALAATTGAQGLATLAVFILPILAPMALPDLGVPPFVIGWQVALVYLAAAIGSGFAGGALRRWGPARCTQIALGAAAVGALAIGYAGLAGAALGSAMIGGGYGFTNPSASQVLSRLAPPDRRNMVFAIKQTGVPLGGAIAGAVLPMVSLWIGWRGAAALVATILALMALLLGAFRPHWDRDRDPTAPLRSGGGGLGVLRRDAGLRALAGIGALFAAIQLSLSAYAVTMLVQEYGWNPVAAGGAAAITQLVGAVARIAWAVPADRIGGLPVLAIIGAGSVASALIMPFSLAWPEAAVVALLALMGFCVAGWNGVLMAEASRQGAQVGPGVAVGAVLACTFTGVVAGPSVFALVVGLMHSYALAFAALAVLPLAGTALAWHAYRQNRSDR